MALQEFVQDQVVAPYQMFRDSLPGKYQLILTIFIYVLMITIYALFIYSFYRLLAKKNIINLNLAQYSVGERTGTRKFLSGVFFVIEYLIVMPLLVIFWFSVLVFLLMLIANEQTLGQVLLIAGALVGSVRVLCYIKEDLAREIAKLFPLTLLVIFLLDKNFLAIIPVFERLVEVGQYTSQILAYLIFIIVFEVFIRLVYSLSIYLHWEEEEDKDEEEEEIEIKKREKKGKADNP